MLRTNLLILLAILVVSCSKEDLKVSSSATESLVKTKTEGTTTESYTYDNQGRVTRIQYTFSDNTPSYYHTYTYNGSFVSEYHSEERIYDLEETLPNGTTIIHCTSNPRLLKLNSNGLFEGGSINCNEAASFEYDANKFLYVRDYEVTDYNSKDSFKNDGKNITEIRGSGFSYGGGEFSYVSTLSYTDKVNTIGNKNFGMLHLGKSSENLLQSERKGTVITTYSYEFDAQQRVIQKTALLDGKTTVTAYTYY